ncbi:glycosyl transferase family protein [Falsihalocynthiibacter sp. S25ZX9]|uniref:glycosyl transferase family protein n=1 Tax=Falsihalocynthiibacter sp. S25ZX9 TaxID=3240870 RepID=UPI003510187A
MTKLAPYVRILGRGPGRSRSLTQEEAFEAFSLVLSGDCAPESVGALLMLMRFRGENSAEIAGCVQALRARISGWETVPVSLDWPTYAAGRTRGLPYFLLAAKLVAQSGETVLLHGWNSHQNPLASVREQLAPLGIASVTTPQQTRDALQHNGVAYAPLEDLSPEAFRVLKLRDVFGLRSAVNTTLRVFNPTEALASVQGVFHPSYRELQADAGALLGLPSLSVIKGGGGEFERHPSKDVQAFGLRETVAWEGIAPSLMQETRKLAEDAPEPENLAAFWRGDITDPFAEAIVTGTTGLALLTLGKAATIQQADERARQLWAARTPSM